MITTTRLRGGLFALLLLLPVSRGGADPPMAVEPSAEAWPVEVSRALEGAGANRGGWEAALARVPAGQRGLRRALDVCPRSVSRAPLPGPLASVGSVEATGILGIS